MVFHTGIGRIKRNRVVILKTESHYLSNCMWRFTHSTHGAFGAIAFGIGTSEVEMVLATVHHATKTKKMRIVIGL
jgi:hypothetical protein